MRIQCQLTGITVGYSSLPLADNSPLVGHHPIFTLSHAQLLRVASELDNPNAVDSALLFLAFLVRLPTVQVTSKIAPDSISPQLAETSLPLLITANNAPSWKICGLPQLALSQDCIVAGGLHSWLDLLREGLQYGSITSQRPDDEQEPAVRAAIFASDRRTKVSFKLTISWAIDNMLIRCPGFSTNGLRSLTQILQTGTPVNLEYMYDLKGRILDHLPENTSDNAYRKRLVIEKIDTCIADALLLSATLGLHTPQEIAGMAADMASTYTVEGVVNSAALPAKKLAQVAQVLAAPAKPVVIGPKRTYTPEEIKANPMLTKLREKGLI